MFAAIVLVVETNESHPVPGKFTTRADALEAGRRLASKLIETYGEGFTWDFIISPLE